MLRTRQVCAPAQEVPLPFSAGVAVKLCRRPSLVISARPTDGFDDHVTCSWMVIHWPFTNGMLQMFVMPVYGAFGRGRACRTRLLPSVLNDSGGDPSTSECHSRMVCHELEIGNCGSIMKLQSYQ